MKLLFSVILFVFIGSLSFSQTSYFVNVSGNDNNSGLSESNAWKTITYAASASSPVGPGDIVNIKAGDYGNEYIVFEIDGTALDPIKFIGYTNSPQDNPNLNYQYGDPLDESVMPLIDGVDRSVGIGITMHNTSYIELSNIQIKNYRFGLYAYRGEFLKMKNIIATTFGDINHAYDGKGIVVGSFALGNVIEDCVVLNACAEGLSVIGDRNTIRNCQTYADDNSTGIKSAMDYYIHVAGNDNVIENCFVERIGAIAHNGHGIDLKGNCENNIIRNCTVKGMAINGYELRHRGVKNNVIENCVAINCGFTIRDGASHNTIRNCKTESADYAVILLDTTEDEDAQYAGRNNTIENCLFQNTVLSSINLLHYGSAAVSVVDSNTFVNCVFDGGEYFVNADRENYDNNLSNCIFTNIQNFIGSSYYGSPFPVNFNFDHSYFHNNGFVMPNGIALFDDDPQFVDIANNNYQLSDQSPCIDAGTNTNAPAVDFDGNIRPYNGVVDIGAYEYGYTSNCTTCQSLWSTDGTHIYYNGAHVGIGTNNPSHKLHVAGDVAIAGSVIAPSDRRLKTDIKSITQALSIIESLAPKSYVYRSDQMKSYGLPDQEQFGFIAQEMERVLPSIVKDKAILNEDGPDYKGIRYEQLIPILVQAVKELHVENQMLQKENKEYEKTISSIIKRLSALESEH